MASSSSLYTSGTALDTLVHVQLGQNVQNSAISTILSYCPNLRHIHCNRCPDLQVNCGDMNVLTATIKLKYPFDETEQYLQINLKCFIFLGY